MKSLIMEKLNADYQAYKDTIIKSSTGHRELLDKAYEIVWKENILTAMDSIDENRLEPEILQRLQKENHPLNYLYQVWMKSDYSFQDQLEEVMITGLRYERSMC